MLIGVPKEIKRQEYRVAITPAGVEALTALGHRVMVEQGAGVASGFTDDFYEKDALVRSRDGAPLADQTSYLLWGGVSRAGNDRYRVSSGKAGETLTVLRGRDGRVAFTRLVPGSKDVTSLSAEADRLGTAACSDVVASGTGRTRAVLAVLASDEVRHLGGGHQADQPPSRTRLAPVT